MKEGDILDEKFKLVRQIGVGGMGSVWEALELPAGRRVALKSLHNHLVEEPELTARFLREARAALESRYSGHIIEMIDVVNHRGRPPYLVMEYLEGEDLYQISQRDGKLEITRAVNLIIQSCEAVDEVHRQSIIHRDIKPDNIFVIKLKDGSEWIKLLDFGVAKFTPNAPTQGDSLTKFGHTLGTPDYMAPEQAMGTGKIDYRVDVYSMGVVLYQLLAGRLPYQSDDLHELMLMSARGNPPLLSAFRSEISEGLEQVVRKAMAVDREERFQSMFELSSALQPFRTESAGTRKGRGQGGLSNVVTRREKISKEAIDRIKINDPAAFTPDVDPYAVTVRRELGPIMAGIDAPATLIESSQAPDESPADEPAAETETKQPRQADPLPQSRDEAGGVVGMAPIIIDDDDETVRDQEQKKKGDGEERRTWMLWVVLGVVAALALVGVTAIVMCNNGPTDGDAQATIAEPDGSTSPATSGTQISANDGGPQYDSDGAFGLLDEPLATDADADADRDGAADGDGGADLDGAADALLDIDAWLNLNLIEEEGPRKGSKSAKTRRHVDTKQPEKSVDEAVEAERFRARRSVRALRSDVSHCLSHRRMRDTQVQVFFLVQADGRIEFTGAQPGISRGARRCIRGAVSNARTEPLSKGPVPVSMRHKGDQ